MASQYEKLKKIYDEKIDRVTDPAVRQAMWDTLMMANTWDNEAHEKANEIFNSRS